jgi:hypothetical protein
VAPKKMNVPDSGLTMENRAPNASRKVVTEIPFESRALALGARSVRAAAGYLTLRTLGRPGSEGPGEDQREHE